MFAREGYPFAVGGLVLAAVAWIVVRARPESLLYMAAAVSLSGLAIFVLWFFRNPAPRLPTGADLVVAPGQGKVIGIDRVDEPSFIGGAAHKISIFLSVFDVHVQRAPVTGTVRHKSYRPGTYAVAWADKASEDNEQASLGIETTDGPVLVRQIAGLVARRIVTDPDVGQEVERGGRIGLIRFGSRVDLFLPEHWIVSCRVGDRVRVGQSVLARRAPRRDEPAEGTGGAHADVGAPVAGAEEEA